MKVKTYNTMPSEEMYTKYKEADDKKAIVYQFVEQEKEHGVLSDEDFFSLLLSEAIQQNDLELVQDILRNVEKDSYPELLTSVDKSQMGPLTYTLLLDDRGEIKAYIKEALNHGYRFHKVEVPKGALQKIVDVVGYQGESYQECIDAFIKPIVIEEEVQALGHAIDDGVLTY